MISGRHVIDSGNSYISEYMFIEQLNCFSFNFPTPRRPFLIDLFVFIYGVK
jgi:hypothetical protein